MHTVYDPKGHECSLHMSSSLQRHWLLRDAMPGAELSCFSHACLRLQTRGTEVTLKLVNLSFAPRNMRKWKSLTVQVDRYAHTIHNYQDWDAVNYSCVRDVVEKPFQIFKGPVQETLPCYWRSSLAHWITRRVNISLQYSGLWNFWKVWQNEKKQRNTQWTAQWWDPAVVRPCPELC